MKTSSVCDVFCEAGRDVRGKRVDDVVRKCGKQLISTKYHLYELTVKIVEYLGIESLISIKEVKSEQFDNKEEAKRPHEAILSNDKLEHMEMNFQRNWEDSLQDYLDDAYYKEMFNNIGLDK